MTGAAGLLGRAAVPLLLEHGYEVLALGRDAARLAESVGQWAVCRATGYAEGELSEALAGCAAVVHLAGRRVAPAGEGVAPFLEPNVAVTDRVLRSAAAAGVPMACLASSISVYSTANAHPFDEGRTPYPGSVYGLSKLAAEHLGRQWAAVSSRRVVSLRLASLIGADDETAGDRMLAVFLDRAQRRQPLVIWGEGSGGRDLLYVRDVARAIAASLAPGAPGGCVQHRRRPSAFLP